MSLFFVLVFYLMCHLYTLKDIRDVLNYFPIILEVHWALTLTFLEVFKYHIDIKLIFKKVHTSVHVNDEIMRCVFFILQVTWGIINKTFCSFKLK